MKLLKRTVTFFMVLALLLSLPLLVTTDAAEDDYEDYDIYVYHHQVEGNGYTGSRYQYFSPYMCNYNYDGQDSYYMSIFIWTLYNTTSGQVVPAYCTDIDTGAYAGHTYRRQNLEDSTYASTSASQLRAIVLNGFYLPPIYDETMDEHNTRAQAKLAELAAAVGIPDLTVGEAIAGTQNAIWQAAHGSRLYFTNFTSTFYTSKSSSLFRYYDLCNLERTNGHYTSDAAGKARIAPRIEAVYDYLLSLEPVEASEHVISAASFKKASVTAPTPNANGSYDITLKVTVNVNMKGGDDLTLTAKSATSNTASAALTNGTQTVSLTLKNVPEDITADDITLAIDGHQTVFDVFLYDAKGDRGTAQSMIGMDGSQQLVHTQLKAGRILTVDERIVNFYKTAKIENAEGGYDRFPLEGIAFDIYFVAEMEDYLAGNVILPDPEDFDYPAADYTVTTNSEGFASVNFTQQGFVDGIYLVVERTHPAIVKPVEPFYLQIPNTNSDGVTEYEITIQPKNELKGGVRIEKDVISIGNNNGSADAYENHTWIIGTTVPDDIASGKEFVISDTLDSRLDYIGNVKATLEKADGSEVIATLTAGTDYIVLVDDVDSLSEGKQSDSFTLELTPTGMTAVANAVGSNNFDDYMLRVYFDAQINANAEMGTTIPNEASLEYQNSVNFVFHAQSDKPVITTGAVNLLKVDSVDNTVTLSGAIFEVYRNATADEVAAGGNKIINIKGVVAPVVKVSFYDNAALKGEKVASVTSDENGMACIYGLAYGEYYLVETQAPAGYNAFADALPFSIDGTSHTENMTITIENVSGVVLPNTGGMGTTIFTLIGGALVLLSVVLLVTKKRMRNYN